MHYSFVILHYMAVEDTLACVASILSALGDEDYSLVVVDNGSPDGSGKRLLEEVGHHERVTILIEKENLGFAQGNNVGFRHAKRINKADFVVMINNDTLLQQKDFLRTIGTIYEETAFHVLGPDILSLVDGGHQNPPKGSTMTKRTLQVSQGLNTLYYGASYLHLDRVAFRLVDGLYRLKAKGQKKGDPVKDEEITGVKEGVQLHGSALIFSPLYLEKHEGLYGETFMYMEEDILFYLAKKTQMKMVYDPRIQILHKEDSSTKATFSSDVKRRRFKYKHHIHSAKVFLALMQKDHPEF